MESRNKTYDVVLDYIELEWMAEQSEHDVAWWLDEFKSMGVTKVGLTEENLTTLMEDSPLNVTATMMGTVMQDAGWRDSYPDLFVQELDRRGYDRFDVIVEITNTSEFNAILFLVQAVEERFPAGSYFCCGPSADEAYIFLDGQASDALYGGDSRYTSTYNTGFVTRSEIVSSKLLYVSLGLMPEKVELIQSAGMEIIPRTLCYDGHNDTQYAQAVARGYEKYGIVPDYIIAGGEAVIGYDDGGDFVLDYLRENDITIGLIETNVQRENIMQSGVEDATAATDFNTVRVFTMWDYLQYRYGYFGYEGAEEIENALYRAVVERNIRVLYFKPGGLPRHVRRPQSAPGRPRHLHGPRIGDGELSGSLPGPAGYGPGGRGGRRAAAGHLPAHEAEMDPGSGGHSGSVRVRRVAGTAQLLPAAGQLCQRGGFRLSGRRLLPHGRQTDRGAARTERGPCEDSPPVPGCAGGGGTHLPGGGHAHRSPSVLHQFHAGAGHLPGGQGRPAAAPGLLLPAVSLLLRPF